MKNGSCIVCGQQTTPKECVSLGGNIRSLKVACFGDCLGIISLPPPQSRSEAELHRREIEAIRARRAGQ